MLRIRLAPEIRPLQRSKREWTLAGGCSGGCENKNIFGDEHLRRANASTRCEHSPVLSTYPDGYRYLQKPTCLRYREFLRFVCRVLGFPSSPSNFMAVIHRHDHRWKATRNETANGFVMWRRCFCPGYSRQSPSVGCKDFIRNERLNATLIEGSRHSAVAYLYEFKLVILLGSVARKEEEGRSGEEEEGRGGGGGEEEEEEEEEESYKYLIAWLAFGRRLARSLVTFLLSRRFRLGVTLGVERWSASFRRG